VVSFYSFFTTQPKGKHTIKFCLGTACYVRGTPQLVDKARQALGSASGKPPRTAQLPWRCVVAWEPAARRRWS